MNVPDEFFAKGTLRSWGGSILETFVVGVMAITALAGVGEVMRSRQAARARRRDALKPAGSVQR